MQSRSIRCALVVASFFLSGVHLASAQLQPIVPPTPGPIKPAPTPSVNPDELIPVVIHYGEGQETRASVHRGVLAPVGLLQNQLVNVTLLLPPTRAGEPVTFGLYDGGQLSVPGRIEINDGILPTNVSVDGTVRFNFKAGRILGLYRLLVAVGPSHYLLQFYAVPRATGNPLPVPTPTPSPEG